MNLFGFGNKTLQDLSRLDSHMKLVPKNGQQPEHLRTWGKIQKDMPSGKISEIGEIDIAVTQDEGLSKFSSLVGSHPNNALVRAVVGNVNELMNGKIIQDGSDLLHVTEKPTDWLTRERLKQECQTHAVTKVTLEPIFDRLPDLSVPTDPKAIDKLAQDLVEGGLRLPQPHVSFLSQPPRDN